MSDWKETEGEGDEWGAIAYAYDCGDYGTDTLSVGNTGEALRFTGQGTTLWRHASDALWRAHDLRNKAPGTECKRCDGDGKVLGRLRGGVPASDCLVTCHDCHGSGRGLTPAELERWKGWAK